MWQRFRLLVGVRPGILLKQCLLLCTPELGTPAIH